MSKLKSTTVKRIMEYLNLKTEENLNVHQIAERMKVSKRQVERYAKQTQDVIFTDEYKKDATMKFLKIWLDKLKDAKSDYNKYITKINIDTGDVCVDNQARAQFSRVYNDTIKEAERYLSKIGILEDKPTELNITHKSDVLDELSNINKYLTKPKCDKDTKESDS